MGTDRPNRQKRGVDVRSMMASYELDRLGINPIEELNRCMTELKAMKEEALKAYKDMRGYGEKNDAGTQYLASAIKAISDQAAIATTLAKFKHPTLSAVAVKDMTDPGSAREPMTTAQAIEVIKNDPFASPEVKNMPTERILEAMNTPMNAPFLPSGKKNE